jgi:hypothetical protein
LLEAKEAKRIAAWTRGCDAGILGDVQFSDGSAAVGIRFHPQDAPAAVGDNRIVGLAGIEFHRSGAVIIHRVRTDWREPIPSGRHAVDSSTAIEEVAANAR